VLFGQIAAVTGASRFEQEADQAPASVTVITADEIARQGWRTLGEVLQSVRGIYTTYDRNYTYLAVRGFGRPGDYNTRVLVLLDGQRLNVTLRLYGWPKGLSTIVSAYNVFDCSYGDPGSAEHLQTAIPQDRRHFRPALKFAF
jgi:outer membrane receptor protein involved in Fe transport